LFFANITLFLKKTKRFPILSYNSTPNSGIFFRHMLEGGEELLYRDDVMLTGYGWEKVAS